MLGDNNFLGTLPDKLDDLSKLTGELIMNLEVLILIMFQPFSKIINKSYYRITFVPKQFCWNYSKGVN